MNIEATQLGLTLTAGDVVTMTVTTTSTTLAINVYNGISAASLADTVTETGTGAVKSSGIWAWVKSLRSFFLNYIDFNTDYSDGVQEGRLQWNSDDGTLEVGMPGGHVNLQIGQETLIRAKKATGQTILNGSVVYISGASGGRPEVSLADADSYSTSFVLGVATEAFTGATGYVTMHGLVRDVNTLGMAEGAPIWLSQTAGQFTTTRPTAPAMHVFLGYVITAHATEGLIAVRPVVVPRATGLSDVYASPSAFGDLLAWNPTTLRYENYDGHKVYAGFVNRTDSTISIDASGVFTLAPAVTSFVVYVNGKKFTLTTSQTVTVTEDQNLTFIYLDSSGVLQKSTSSWDLTSGLTAPVAIVFKDGTNYAKTDERHGYERNKAWHNWAHFNIGAMYRSGLTGTFANATLSVTQGVIADEDIVFDTEETKTTASLWYRNGASGMRMIRSSSTPYYQSGGVIYYDNNSGTLQPVTNNRYTTVWVYASNDPVEPIYVVVGQNNDVNVATARNAARPTINLSTAEWKLIYRVIYRNAGGTATYIEAADFRTVQTGTPTAAVTTDHAALINRDALNSHPTSAITSLNSYLADLADCACPISLDSLTFVVDSPTQATITVVATGGVGTLTYSLYDGVTLIEENETGIFVVTEAKTYTVKVNDEVGSTEDSGDVVVAFFDADMLTYISGLSTPLSEAQQVKLNTLFTSIKTGWGVSTLAEKAHQMLLLSGETAECSLRNMVKRQYDATPVNSPTWTQFEGYKGNDVDMYIDTNFNPNTGGAELNNTAYGFYQRLLRITSADYVFGASRTSIVLFTETGANARLHNSLADTVTAVLGMNTISRIASAGYTYYPNKAAKTDITQASAALPDCKVFLLCYSLSDVPNNFSDTQLAFYFVTKGLTQAENDVLVNAVEVYMDSNGKGVVS